MQKKGTDLCDKLKSAISRLSLTLQELGQNPDPHLEDLYYIEAGFTELHKNAEPKKDSSNSSEPPSGDKERSGNPTGNNGQNKGGQKGHPGTVINQFKKPSRTVHLTPDREKLENDPDWKKIKTIKRQLVEIKFSREVTEYSVDVFENIKTGERISGEFPDGVEAPLQYGPSVAEFLTILRDQQMLPYERIALFVNSMFDLGISSSTVCNIVKRVEQSKVLNDHEEAAKISSKEAPCLNADESFLA
jgi:transposase